MFGRGRITGLLDCEGTVAFRPRSAVGPSEINIGSWFEKTLIGLKVLKGLRWIRMFGGKELFGGISKVIPNSVYLEYKL